MALIELHNLQKTYRVYQKKEGLRASIKGLFKRTYKDVQGSKGLTFRWNKGSSLPSWVPTVLEKLPRSNCYRASFILPRERPVSWGIPPGTVKTIIVVALHW